MASCAATQPTFSLQPSFLTALASDKVKTILLTGCGGGFDFVHGALLLPHLKQLGKRVIILSYSFGSTDNISNAEVVFSEKTPQGPCEAKLVTANATGSPKYEPEIGLCAYLDTQWPDEAPHQVYACYARLFSVPMLVRLYRQVIREHGVDTVVTIDGGSDSLMRGDEYGLGDPIEDTVSVTAASELSEEEDGVHTKLLISAGFGMDRFNNVCDADGLRAIAELSQSGGFRGSISIEPTADAFIFYRNAVDFLNERATFRSVMTAGLVAAVEGSFGYTVPKVVASRVREGHLFVWPLMGMLFAFDTDAVARRSLLAPLLRDLEHRVQCDDRLEEMRRDLRAAGKLRDIAELPTHQEVLNRRFNVQADTRDVVVNSAPVETKESSGAGGGCAVM